MKKLKVSRFTQLGLALPMVLILGLLAAMQAQAQTTVLINEVDADTPGSDTLEFVELYDGGVGNTPLDGLVLVLFNGGDDASYRSFDLDGKATDANGYFVLGNAAVAGVDLPFADGTLQNGADAVALYPGNASDFPNNTPVTTANLRDAIVYDTNDADDLGLLPLLNAGQPQRNEAGAGDATMVSNQRCPNGSGGVRNTDNYLQANPTPGATNACPSVTLSVNVVGNVGSDAVTSAGGNPSPGPIACPTSLCTATFDFNDVVTLNVTVDASSGFVGWSGDCVALGSNLSGVLTMDGAKSCTATFAVPLGTGNTVFISPDGSDANDCLSPETACASIQVGVNTVLSGGMVVVDRGRYGGNISINKSLNLRCNPASNSAFACRIEGAQSITVNANDVAINGFVFQDFGAGPAINATDGVSLHGNAFVGSPGSTGVNGLAVAENNWWGCNAGPNDTTHCTTATGGTAFDPWLVASLDATPNPTTTAETTQLTLDLTRNSAGQIVSNSLSRPTSLSVSGGTLVQNGLVVTLGPSGHALRTANSPNLVSWTFLSLLLGLLLRLVSRHRCKVATTLVLLLSTLSLSGCGLFSGTGLQAVPQTVSASMVNGVASATLRSSLPSDITITGEIDRETLTKVVRFLVRSSSLNPSGALHKTGTNAGV